MNLFTRTARFTCLTLAALAAVSTPALAQQTLDMQLQPPAEQKTQPRNNVTLPSRSMPSRENVRAKIGRVGFVRSDSASIHRSRSDSSPVLFSVKNGTPLAVVNTVGSWYGVLMVDGSTGWVDSSSLGISDLNVVANGSLGDGGIPLIQHALTYLGIPYVWGGASRAGTDCSGFVKQVFNRFGVALPRTAREQALVGAPVSTDQLAPGDRLYFRFKGGAIDHTGIYMGNGNFVHSSSSRGGVGIDQLFTPRYQNAFVGARRS